MTSNDTKRKVIDAIASSRFMTRLATSLRTTDVQSITPNDLDQMARILIQKAKELRFSTQDG